MTSLEDRLAFPMPSGSEPRVNESTHYNEGMSLRDYFAGMVLCGLSRIVADHGFVKSSDDPHAEWIAHHAYTIAEAMLAEREKKEGGQ